MGRLYQRKAVSAIGYEKKFCRIRQNKIPRKYSLASYLQKQADQKNKLQEYGEIYIKLEDQKLKISFQHTPAFTATLEHYHYNTFRSHWDDPMISEGLITFKTSAKNQVTGIEFDQPRLLDANFSELDVWSKLFYVLRITF